MNGRQVDENIVSHNFRILRNIFCINDTNTVLLTVTVVQMLLKLYAIQRLTMLIMCEHDGTWMYMSLNASVKYPHKKRFYSILGCVLQLQEVALHQSPPTCSVLCYPWPYCSLLPHNVISSRHFGLPISLTPFFCHSVLLMVHLFLFIWAVCPAHFHYSLLDIWLSPNNIVFGKYAYWSALSGFLSS